MKLTRNKRGASKLLITLLLLLFLAIGAILSYMWVMGWYLTLQIRVPEKTALSIENVSFNPEDTSFLNVTVLNPSFSGSDYATITEFWVLTEDGAAHKAVTYPPLPYRLPAAENKTFTLYWNWGNYSGQTINVMAFVTEGSGATFKALTPLVKLYVKVNFDPSISVNYFNMSVHNSENSAIDVKIKDITINGVSAQSYTLTSEGKPLSLPFTLHRNETVSITCSWNWTEYQGKNVTIAVRTSQGYIASRIKTLPPPVILNITDVTFIKVDGAYFNVTIQNSEESPTYVNITRITITMDNGTVREITKVSPKLTPPYAIYPGSSETFICVWNWHEYRGREVTITVYTLQGFVIRISRVMPS